MSIQYQQGFLSALLPTSISTPGDSLSVHQDIVEDPAVLAQILFPQVDKTRCKMIKMTSKIISSFSSIFIFRFIINNKIYIQRIK